ncbi:helix-turn-helix domain-containing protein [bacterium]|nr:helix-turn-helix domain-containing protein [bacterium]
MDENGNNEFLTVAEIASVLRKKERTVREWCYARTIPHYKLGGSLLFSLKEVMDWVKEKHRVSIRQNDQPYQLKSKNTNPPKLTI